MDYILNPETDGIDFDRYAIYLESICAQLPLHVYAFASNPNHFNLDSPSSLHDAWLEALTIREVATGNCHDQHALEIVLCLLGPRQDRRIHLSYIGVSHYVMQSSGAHGDLLSHEIRLSSNGEILHEMQFVNGASILIECSDMRHFEDMNDVFPCC